MKGFISYSHVDHDQFMILRRHLKAVERSLGVDLWADTRIKPGNYWNANIQTAITDATIHVLLFSPGFIASDYIFDHELPAICQQKISRNDLVLPIVVKRCIWGPFINVLQALPADGKGSIKPVCEWNKNESGYHAASEQIHEAIKSHFALTPTLPIDWGTP